MEKEREPAFPESDFLIKGSGGKFRTRENPREGGPRRRRNVLISKGEGDASEVTGRRSSGSKAKKKTHNEDKVLVTGCVKIGTILWELSQKTGEVDTLETCAH